MINLRQCPVQMCTSEKPFRYHHQNESRCWLVLEQKVFSLVMWANFEGTSNEPIFVDQIGHTGKRLLSLLSNGA